MVEIRDILVATCHVLEEMDCFLAKGLKYKQEIYIAPVITWLESGAPLELQVIDGGDQTQDRDGSVRRAQMSLTVALLMRRPTQFKGQHGSILDSIDDDLQTYARAIRLAMDGNFLPTTLIAGGTEADLLVRPWVYMSGSAVQTNPQYPDLLAKALQFTGGINDELI
jgi:hypothetical protein